MNQIVLAANYISATAVYGEDGVLISAFGHLQIVNENLGRELEVQIGIPNWAFDPDPRDHSTNTPASE